MSAHSLPVAVMAGITFYVGVYHFFIFLRRRTHRADLTFALTCLAVSAYDVFCVGLYNATSVVEGVVWQRAQFVAVMAGVGAFLWFMADYTGLASRRIPESIQRLIAVTGIAECRA